MVEKIHQKLTSGTVTEMPSGMPASQINVCEFGPALLQIPASCQSAPWETAGDGSCGQVSACTCLRLTQSGLVQPWLLQVSGGGGGRVNQWMEDLSTFQVNKLHKRILPRGRTEGMCYF